MLSIRWAGEGSRLGVAGVRRGQSMRNTNRGTLAARVVALVGSTLMAVALLASPGYAGPDRVDQGRDRPGSVAGQLSQLRDMIAHRSQGRGLQVQSNGAGDVECTGLLTGDFDSVTVPPGQLCFLLDSTVAGNVTVEEDALLAAGGNMIGGNLAGDGYEVVQAVGNRIGGNVRLQNGGPSTIFFEHTLCGNLIGGNVSLQRSTGFVTIGGPECGTNAGNIVGGNVSVTDGRTNAPDEFHVDNNLVDEDMDIDDNRGNGPKTVQNNLVNETLDCDDNQNPFIGTPNNADRARGQCAP
jgi:hypothetical protein